MNFEDIKLYLPKFLSTESGKELFEGLKDFPDNIDTRLYTSYLTENIIYQGDGLKNMLVINLPKTEIKLVPSMILSNTCDIDIKNAHNFHSQIVYTPIFNLKKYKNSLYKNSQKTKEQLDSHILAIKKQEITQIFFLPKINEKLDESIIFFDRLYNYPNNLIKRESIKERRIFSLSDYGIYIFLLKLSIHFTRIKDNVERRSLRI